MLSALPMTSPEHRRTRRLAEVLNRLMGRTNLTPALLARRAVVSPGTVTNLLRGAVSTGKPSFASPDMLKQIALGLATNGLGERDLVAAQRYYGELMAAIGYLDAPDLIHPPDLPSEVQAAITDNLDLVIEVGTLGPLRPEDAILVREAIAKYRARFVQPDESDGESA